MEKPRSREPSQPALSYEHIENFTKDLEVRRDLGNRAHMKDPKTFLEVSRCSGAKNVQKECAARAKLLFLLISPIVVFHRSPALPSRLALHDFIFGLNKL